MAAAEKRSHPRIPMRQAVELDMGRERWFEAQGFNISTGGILLETWQPIDLLADVQLVFELPGKGKPALLSVEGVVRHVTREAESWKAGVEFCMLDDKQVAQIERYIKYHQK